MRDVRVWLNDETGAVTVDWVVLTAAIAGLGLASTVAVRTGLTALSADIESSLSSASVAQMGTLGDDGVEAPGYQLLYPWQNDDVLTYWQTETFPTWDDDYLVTLYEQYVSIASGGSMPSFMDLSYAMLGEMTERGLATDAHRESFETSYSVYQ